MTYSIVARDPDTGEMGVAVQSHYFSVGSVVTWAEAGVGAVATQAAGNRAYGANGVAGMRDGRTPQAVLDALTAADEGAETRQVAMIDANGAIAVHTGERCIAHAGHLTGTNYSVQANMMLRDTVPGAMGRAFESSDGDLTDRLLAALDAAEEEGGDIRGRQSAALLVVGGERKDAAYEGIVTEIRIEDDTEPLMELRRLVGIRRAYAALGEGDFEAAQSAVPNNPEFTFWRVVSLANAGKVAEAREVLERSFDASGEWVELLRRLPDAGSLPQDVLEQLVG